MIQKQEKRKLSQIIAQEGPERFKEIENKVNASVDVTETVIAPGGSVIYCEEAMKHLRSIGKVVYLKISLESLSKRLGNLRGRGVLLKEACCSFGNNKYRGIVTSEIIFLFTNDKYML